MLTKSFTWKSKKEISSVKDIVSPDHTTIVGRDPGDENTERGNGDQVKVTLDGAQYTEKGIKEMTKEMTCNEEIGQHTYIHPSKICKCGKMTLQPPIPYQDEKVKLENDKGDVAWVDKAQLDALHPPDMINHPPHYKNHPSGIEAIVILRECPRANLYAAGKYWWRVCWGKGPKDTVEQNVKDIKKAIWHLQDELRELENETS